MSDNQKKDGLSDEEIYRNYLFSFSASATDTKINLSEYFSEPIELSIASAIGLKHGKTSKTLLKKKKLIKYIELNTSDDESTTTQHVQSSSMF